MQRTTWTPWRTFNKKVKQSWWCEDKSECLRDVREAELFWSVGDLINITMWILFAWWTVTYNFVTAQWQICMFYSNILIHVKVSWREIRSKDDVLWIPPLLQLCTVFVFEISRYVTCAWSGHRLWGLLTDVYAVCVEQIKQSKMRGPHKVKGQRKAEHVFMFVQVCLMKFRQ